MYEVGRRLGPTFSRALINNRGGFETTIVKWCADRLDSSFGLMLSKGSQPIEIVGATEGFVACLANRV